MNGVDTNIIFYAHDGRDPIKQATAQSVIRELTNGVLLWQVACEYLATSRKLAIQGYRASDAFSDLRDMQRMWISSPPVWGSLDVAAELSSQHSISFWDALLVAACEHAGVTVLYSEDLGGRRPLRGVTFVNPFAASK